jgi:hypothetical protein
VSLVPTLSDATRTLNSDLRQMDCWEALRTAGKRRRCSYRALFQPPGRFPLCKLFAISFIMVEAIWDVR